jgi:hypothetical protein
MFILHPVSYSLHTIKHVNSSCLFVALRIKYSQNPSICSYVPPTPPSPFPYLSSSPEAEFMNVQFCGGCFWA